MDGLLVDSEKVALQAYIEAAEALGLEVRTDIYLRCVGTNAQGTRHIMTDAFGSDFPLKALQAKSAERHAVITEKTPIPLKDGARERLEWALARPLSMAVATSTSRSGAEARLLSVDVLSYLDCLVCGDEVENGKPHPEIYARAAEGLGIAPNMCLALEDSENGVKSAAAAGMFVIHVPDLIAASSDARSLSHRTMSSLHEVRRFLESADGLPT